MGNVTFDFGDRVVAVTGGAQGIGAAVVAGFGQAGATVYSIDLLHPDREADGEEGERKIACDVTDPRAVEAAMTEIARRSRRLDVLVNNAGGFGAKATTETLGPVEWQRSIDLNLSSVYLVSRAALPLLRESPAGRIINLGSLAAQTAGYTTSPAYAAAKAGVHALSRVMAQELAGSGITVNVVSPSAVLTDRIRALRDQAEREATARSIPLGRYQTPDELAQWVLFLASAEAGFVTGQTIAVNGGRLMV
jgi:3-oxoacyl-[acyl-carrier protein] reductase